MTAQPRGLDANERDTLTIARTTSGRGDATGPLVVQVLIATIERLSESPVRERWWWPTEKADAELGGAR